MEQEERVGGGVVRNQNAVYTLPFDAASLAQVLAPVVERIEAQVTQPQVLVITPDPETALTASRVATQLAGDRGLSVLPATGTARAARRLRARPAHVVAGAPAELLGLIQGSTLKLDGLRVLVLAWLDDILASGADSALEAVLNEVPKDAARTVVAGRITPAIDAFVERYLRRARRLGGTEGDESGSIAVQYVAVAGTARGTALRRLLDQADPANASIFVRSDESEAEVESLLRALGYGDDTSIRATRDRAGAGTELIVLYELPGSRQELRSLVGEGGAAVVALLPPRQLDLLRHLAGDGAVKPLTLAGATSGAHSREAAMREQLREVLREGPPARELLALEPLLEEFDGAEIAAAALRLLERERNRARDERGAPRAPASPDAAAGQTRIFINVGERDNVRVGDIVGALIGEGGATREQIGRVDLRDSHATVELAASAAERVAQRLNGTTIRGRRVSARIDQARGGRAGPRDGSGEREPDRRPASRGPYGERGARGGPPARGARSGPPARGEPPRERRPRRDRE